MSKWFVFTGITFAFLTILTDGRPGLAAAPQAPRVDVAAELAFGSGPGQAGFYNATCKGFNEVYPMGPTSVRGGGTGETILLDNFGCKLLFVAPPDGAGRPAARIAEVSLKNLNKELFLADFAATGPDRFAFADQLNGTVFTARLDRAKGVAEILKKYTRQGTAEGCLYQPQLVEYSNGRLAVADFMRSRLLFFDENLAFLAERPWDLTGLCLTPDGDFATLAYEDGTYSVLVYSRADLKPSRRTVLATAGRTGCVLRGILADGRIVASCFGRAAGSAGGRGAYDVCVFSAQGARLTNFERPASMPDFREMVARGDALLHLDYDADLAPKGLLRVVSLPLPK